MKKIRYISLYLRPRNHYNQGMEKVGTIVRLDPFTLVGKTFKKDLIGDNYISEGWSEIERSLPLLMEACEKGNFTPSLYGIAFDDNTYFAGLKILVFAKVLPGSFTLYRVEEGTYYRYPYLESYELTKEKALREIKEQGYEVVGPIMEHEVDDEADLYFPIIMKS